MPAFIVRQPHRGHRILFSPPIYADPEQPETVEIERMTREMTQAMEDLSERERHILTERRLIDEPKTLEELSEQYNVSRERIRQIEVRAFEKLQKAMKRMAKEQGLPVGA